MVETKLVRACVSCFEAHSTLSTEVLNAISSTDESIDESTLSSSRVESDMETAEEILDASRRIEGIPMEQAVITSDDDTSSHDSFHIFESIPITSKILDEGDIRTTDIQTELGTESVQNADTSKETVSFTSVIAEPIAPVASQGFSQVRFHWIELMYVSVALVACFFCYINDGAVFLS
jgi:hypothetical protein